jgi:outer membrane protein TolC
VQQSEQVFQQLLDIAKVRYANGQGGQQDLARAELEMGMLQERELELNADVDSARAILTRFVGPEAAQRPLADDLPALPAPPGHSALLQRLPQHPRIVAANTRVAAADTATDIARQAYKPVWGVDLSYGRRPGADAAGMPYTNMVTAMVSVSLPLFTGDRQDRSVSAARAASSAAQYAVDDELRELRQMLDTDWAHWEHLGHIRDLYSKAILPSASLNTQATLSAYRNGGADFDELARAQVTDLDSRTQQLKADVDYLGMQADLLYLAGEQP